MVVSRWWLDGLVIVVWWWIGELVMVGMRWTGNGAGEVDW